MNTNTLLLVALGAAALFALTKATGSTTAHSSGTYRLQFPATPGNSSTPAHPDLFTRDEDTNDGSFATLYTKTPSGNYTVAPAFLLDLETGSLVG